jgi:hypothetical protein
VKLEGHEPGLLLAYQLAIKRGSVHVKATLSEIIESGDILLYQRPTNEL